MTRNTGKTRQGRWMEIVAEELPPRMLDVAVTIALRGRGTPAQIATETGTRTAFVESVIGRLRVLRLLTTEKVKRNETIFHLQIPGNKRMVR